MVGSVITNSSDILLEFLQRYIHRVVIKFASLSFLFLSLFFTVCVNQKVNGLLLLVPDTIEGVTILQH